MKKYYMKKYFIFLIIVSIIFIPMTFAKYTNSIGRIIGLNVSSPQYNVRFDYNGGVDMENELFDFDARNGNIDGTANNVTWGSDYVELAGNSSSWVNLGKISDDYMTINLEFSLNEYADYDQVIIGNIEIGGICIYVRSDKKIIGSSYIDNSYRDIVGDFVVELGRKYSVTLSFDGVVEKLFIDDRMIGEIYLDGVINTPENDTVMVLGGNPSGNILGSSFFNGRVYSASIYSNDKVSKTVTHNKSYGDLPTPVRKGYEFMGWNGKNLLNLNVSESRPSSTEGELTTKRTFTPNTYVKGLAFDNYFDNYNRISSLIMTENSLSFTTYSGYGIAYPFLSSAGKSYTLSYIAVINNNDDVYRLPVSSIMFYEEDGTLINYIRTNEEGYKTVSFTTPANTYYLVILLCANEIDTSVTFNNIQLEEGNVATAYEPYYVVSNTLVTQAKDHTLTAIWKYVESPILELSKITSKSIPFDSSWTYTDSHVEDNVLTLDQTTSTATSPYLDVNGEFWYATYDGYSTSSSPSCGSAGCIFWNASYYDSNLDATQDLNNNYSDGYGSGVSTLNSWYNNIRWMNSDNWENMNRYGPNVNYIKISFQSNNNWSVPTSKVRNVKLFGQLYNSFYDVNLNISGSNIVEYKYALGTKNISYFENNGTDIDDNTFRVTKNGTYTVYIKDYVGNEVIKTIVIDKIVDGSEDGPYRIEAIEDLVNLSNNVSGGNTYENKNFSLIRDLDFNSNSSYRNYSRTDYGDINGNGTVESLKTELTTGSGFIPIGNNANSGTPFNGTFNGNNKAIDNLYVDSSDISAGFLGFSSGGVINNLILSGSVITETADDIGGFIGFASSNVSINNCHNNINVVSKKGSSSVGGFIGAAGQNNTISIRNSINSGNINHGNNTGGIVGFNNGSLTITNCYNEGIITNSKGGQAGGLLGRDNASTNSTTIRNSSNSGTVISNTVTTSGTNIGGLVGLIYGTININSSQNLGNITSDYEYPTYSMRIGGFVGTIDGIFSIKNSSNSGTVTSTAISTNVSVNNGGFIGSISQNASGVIEDTYNDGRVIGGSRVGGIVGISSSNKLIVNKSYNLEDIYTETSSSGDYAGTAAGIVGHTWGAHTFIMNSYNIGNILGTSSGGIAGPAGGGDFNNIINCYNRGNVSILANSSGRSVGINLLFNGDADFRINNVYNVGNVVGNIKFGITLVVESSGMTVKDINHAYYLDNVNDGANGDYNNFTTKMTDTNMKNSSFVSTLNSNINNINLASISSDLSGYSLSSWKAGSNGYPVFTWQE